jgi:hypothetical protein
MGMRLGKTILVFQNNSMYFMKDMPVNGVVYVCSGDVSVYESQVLELLQYYIEYKSLDVLLVQGYSSRNEKDNLERKLANYPSLISRLIWFRTYPVYSIFERFHLHSIKKAFLSIPNLKKYVIHVRAEFTGYLTQKAIRELGCGNKIIVDFRAIVLEELRYKLSSHSSNLLRKMLILLQKKYSERFYKTFLSRQDYNLTISSVSPAINEYIMQKYPQCLYPLAVNPNIAGKQFSYSEVERFQVRKELNIPEDALVAICATGSNAIWQKDEETIGALIKRGVIVINLSKNEANTIGCITTRVPFVQMPAYLSASDMAVLWRDHDFINWSASPSKLSEFAAMGLWIIHNKSVSNAVDYVQTTNDGCLVDDVSQIDLSGYSGNLRKERISRGARTFSVEAIADSYISMYI